MNCFSRPLEQVVAILLFWAYAQKSLIIAFRAPDFRVFGPPDKNARIRGFLFPKPCMVVTVHKLTYSRLRYHLQPKPILQPQFVLSSVPAVQFHLLGSCSTCHLLTFPISTYCQCKVLIHQPLKFYARHAACALCTADLRTISNCRFSVFLAA